MKAVGLTRALDKMGRFVFPAELRREMDLNIHDALGIYTDRDRVVLKKVTDCCAVCGGTKDLLPLGDQQICPACLQAAYDKWKKEGERHE